MRWDDGNNHDDCDKDNKDDAHGDADGEDANSTEVMMMTGIIMMIMDDYLVSLWPVTVLSALCMLSHLITTTSFYM